MLKITVELVSAVDPKRNRVLGTMMITNDGTGTADSGNYVATLHAEYTGRDGRKGRLTNFNRRKQSVWSLVGGFLKLWNHTSHSPKELSK